MRWGAVQGGADGGGTGAGAVGGAAVRGGVRSGRPVLPQPGLDPAPLGVPTQYAHADRRVGSPG